MDRRSKNRRVYGVKPEMPAVIEEDSWQLDAPGPSSSKGNVVVRSVGRPRRAAATKAIEFFKPEPEDDIVTDVATEADDDEEVEFDEENDDDEEEEEEDSDDESEEGTYFIDQSGNYYYQATPDSDPVLSEPPKGKYVPEDEGEKPGEDAGISYVLIVDEPGQEKDVKANSTATQSVYHIDESEKNVLIEDGGSEEFDLPAVVTEVAPVKTQQTIKAERRPWRSLTAEKKPPTKVDNDLDEATSPSGEHNCIYCEYTTTKRHLLVRHMKCHSDDRPHKCSVCERGFKTTASLNNHANTHTGAKPHACKHCPSCFTTSGELVRHVRYKHTLEKPHKCPDCDYASVELSKLRRHIRCHTGERPYQCPHCTYASPDTFKLKRHLRIHTGEKPYECDICQARFTQSNSMKSHKLIHNVGDKPMFKCELCPTTCGRKTDLRLHIKKLHTSDQPIQCNKCDQSFPDRYRYKLHSKTHEGERCYKCAYCPYSTTNSRQLESHVLVHTDEKPFSCDKCDQSFRQQQLLRRHTNIYHNPDYVAPRPRDKSHNCPTCDRGFHHKGNLIRHMAIHDPESASKEQMEELKAARKRKISDATAAYPDTFGFDDFEEEELEDEQEEGDEEMEEDDGIEEVGVGEVVGTVPVEHEDEEGNRYVVLEVIQNEDEADMELDL